MRPWNQTWARAAFVFAMSAAIAGCSLEVNINTHHDEAHYDDAPPAEVVRPRPEAAPTLRPPAEEPPRETAPERPPPAPEAPPRPPAPPTPPPGFAPSLPIPPLPFMEPSDRVIRDALFRYGEPSAAPGPPRLEDLMAGPTFTPFTKAPEIRNTSEVREAIRDNYPTHLRNAGREGTVRMYFLIGADGSTLDFRIDRGSLHEGFDTAALRVAGVYRFRAAENRGRPVPVWVSFPITFSVE